MACTITDVTINGQNIDAAGVPVSFELYFRIRECERVDANVYEYYDGSTYGELIYQALAIPVSGPPDPTTGLRLVVLSFTPQQPKSCNSTYHVVIECTHDKGCRFSQDVTINCKNGEPPGIQPCSPTAILVVRNSAGTEVNLGQSCLAQDTYAIEIVSPWSGNATAQWSVTPLPASGGSATTIIIPGATGRQLSYVLPDQLQPQDTGRTFVAVVVDTTPDGTLCISQGAAILPPIHPVACPTAIGFELRRNSQSITPAAVNPYTYANLTAGYYELSVSTPVGPDVNYDWFDGGTTPVQSGASNTFGLNIASSNSPRQIEIFVRAGDCCPPLRSSATLTMTGAPAPGGDGSPGGDTPSGPVTPPADTPGGLPLCGALRALAALALVIFFVSVMFVVCPSPLTPMALPIAATAAAAAAVLLVLAFILCRLDFCGFWGIVIWALRWAIVLGIVIAILITIALPLFLPVLACVALVALGYGVVCGILILWTARRNCAVPAGFSWP